MTKESTTLAVQEAPPLVKASTQLATFLGIETGMMLDTIKAQCFKSTTPDKVSDEQLAAFVSVANALRLNPLLSGMLYCYPAKNGGIEPMIGPDGIFTLLANNSDIVKQADGGPAWYTEQSKEGAEDICTAFINHATKGLLKKKIYLSEWVVGSNPNWVSRRRHMADVRALKQCARQVIHGIPFDEDERKIAEMVNVTDTANEQAPAPDRPDPATLRKRGRPPSAPKDAIDVPATPAETPAATQEPTKAEKPADAPAQPATPAKGKRTTLEKGEKLTIRPAAIISAVVDDLGGPGKPGCIAEIRSPLYDGKVYDMAGARMVAGPDGVKAHLLPVWANGAGVALEVEGRGSKAHGVIVLVTKVTPIAPQEEKPKAEEQEQGGGLGLEA
jgi:hypothetical protein